MKTIVRLELSVANKFLFRILSVRRAVRCFPIWRRRTCTLLARHQHCFARYASTPNLSSLEDSSVSQSRARIPRRACHLHLDTFGTSPRAPFVWLQMQHPIWVPSKCLTCRFPGRLSRCPARAASSPLVRNAPCQPATWPLLAPHYKRPGHATEISLGDVLLHAAVPAVCAPPLLSRGLV